MADKGMVRHDIQGHDHGSCKTRQEVSKSNKGNIPADMVDMQGWLEEREGRQCSLKTKFN